MMVPQVVVLLLLLNWGANGQAIAVYCLMVGQAVLMARLLKDPIKQALFYSGFGVPLFVSGMMVSAFALRSLMSAS
jgi:chlorophyll synthase